MPHTVRNSVLIFIITTVFFYPEEASNSNFSVTDQPIHLSPAENSTWNNETSSIGENGTDIILNSVENVQAVSWTPAENSTWNNETFSISESGTVIISNSGENVTVLEPSSSSTESSSSESSELKEEKRDNRTCETRRGILRRKLTLKVGYGYFSLWGCKIKLCNASAQIEFIRCKDLQEIFDPPAIMEEEIDMWKLDCFKSDCNR